MYIHGSILCNYFHHTLSGFFEISSHSSCHNCEKSRGNIHASEKIDKLLCGGCSTHLSVIMANQGKFSDLSLTGELLNMHPNLIQSTVIHCMRYMYVPSWLYSHTMDEKSAEEVLVTNNTYQSPFHINKFKRLIGSKPHEGLCTWAEVSYSSTSSF